MAADVVVLRTFGSEMEARIAAAALEANGIAALVSADTAGGALPSMSLLFPVRLLVHAADAALAREILDGAEEGADERGYDEPPDEEEG